MNKSASELGKLSAKKRGLHNMTSEQRSEYMKMVRAKKTPVIKNEAILTP